MGHFKCRAGFAVALFVAFIVAAAATSTELRTPPVPAAEVSAAVPVVEAPLLEFLEGTVQRNSTLVATLVGADVAIAIANQVATLVQPVFDLRRDFRAGNSYRVAKDDAGNLLAFEYRIDDERILKVEKQEEDAYAASVETIAFETREVFVDAEIDSSLWAALNPYPKGDSLTVPLAKIFQWDVDFNVDIQKGAAVRLVVDEYRHEGEFVKYGVIRAAHLVNSGKTYQAYLYNDQYYDENANALQRDYLISPLEYSRISSGFTQRRMHPILGVNRPHLAVDYAAPTGTPVVAVASGTVTFAGANGGLGNYVEIRHANGIATGYAHLSRISSGVRAGRAIKQGESVGAVGQTGLATGPHLHFSMTRNGAAINPLDMRSEPPPPMDPLQKPGYFAAVGTLQSRLNSNLQFASIGD